MLIDLLTSWSASIPNSRFKYKDSSTLLCRDDITRNDTGTMHHIYQMRMTDELFWRWSYILYLCLCSHLCAYESELNNSKCHFLWIMNVPELSYTKDSNINICNFWCCALCRSRRLSEKFSSLMERRVTYLRIAESWYLAMMRPRATSTNYLPHSYWSLLGPLLLTFA